MAITHDPIVGRGHGRCVTHGREPASINGPVCHGLGR
jgi:hypothetical protein